jgi:hypothetical protein
VTIRIVRACPLWLLLFLGLGLPAAKAGESAEALIQAGIDQLCAKFAAIVSGFEGDFTTVNQFGCLGAFQFCPGTFELYYQGTADQFLHDPKGQVKAWIAFEQTQWALAEKNNLTKLIGETVKFKEKTATIDPSAILLACQFGCGKGGKLANYFADAGRDCNARDVKDGNGVSICTNLITGAGQNVSCFTGAPVIPNPNGACGSSNGASLTSAPIANLCSAGMASSVGGSGPWAWSCAGSNGGTTASCNANPITNSGPVACGPDQFNAEGPLEIAVGHYILRFSSAASTETVKKYLDLIAPSQ